MDFSEVEVQTPERPAGGEQILDLVAVLVTFDHDAVADPANPCRSWAPIRGSFPFLILENSVPMVRQGCGESA